MGRLDLVLRWPGSRLTGGRRLPWRARLVVAAALTAGGTTLGWAIDRALGSQALRPAQIAVGAVFGLAMVTAWVWPLRIFRDGQAEALHVDEGFFVLMALLLPSWAVVCAFTGATLAAQAVTRRPMVKSAFNTGQVVASAGAGLAVLHHFGRAPGPIGPADLGAATLGAGAYMAVNTAAFVAVVSAMGASARKAFRDGLGVRLVVVSGGVTTALVAALAVRADAWSTPLAAVPFVLIPRVLSGHFKAHHDRARLRGLFDATLDANRGGDAANIREVVAEAARLQLSCAATGFADHPGDRGLSAPLVVNGRTEWLVASPEGRTAPFDADDHTLLEALAAVGATALTNAALYEESRRQRENLATITSSLGEGVCALDLDGRVTFANPAAAELLGWPDNGDLPGAGIGGRPLPAPTFLLLPALRAIETGARVTSFDSQFDRTDGGTLAVAYTAAPIAGPEGPQGAVIAFRDMTMHKRLEEELSRFAFHDSLTGLANRRLFEDHLRRAIERSARRRERHAVLFADIDRFKQVNDGLGHHAGDELLKVIAVRIQDAVRPGDIVARFGGDEFTVLLEGVDHERDAVVVARRIADRLGQPIALADGHELVVTASIGIALTASGDDHEDAIRNADVAMYAAKRRASAGAYEVFDRLEMGVRSSARIDLETDLRRALDRGEIDVHFQPIVCTRTGQIRGAEALARWRHPGRGLVLPGDFIPLAEESGLILPLGRHVLEESCRWARRWGEELEFPLLVTVNLSARQFNSPSLELELESILQRTGVDPHQLCLEITESTAVDDIERTDEILRGLRHLGLQVAVDDFGTGYSSLAYLNRFPVDVVKIDQSFVRQLGRDRVSEAIVSAVITMAEAIDATTVAEGVETVEQLERLAALSCPRVQGYLLAPPVPGVQIGPMILERVDPCPRPGELMVD